MGTIQLSYDDQLGLLAQRGCKGIRTYSDLEAKSNHYQKQINSLASIGYYTIKNYMYPFMNQIDGQYHNIRFDDVIARYYRDKHLKQALLQAIEDIEVALNTRISNYLGEHYGAFGYKDFSSWCQRNEVNPFIGNHGTRMTKFELTKAQLKFLSDLQYKVKKSSLKDVQDYENDPSSKWFPSVWLMMNLLTLGDSIHLYKLMAKSGRRAISDQFGCTTEELVRWLECVNLIRNICCHNGNLIDFRLKTHPVVPIEFRGSLYQSTDGNGVVYTNRIALPVFVVVKLINSINPRYKFKPLRAALHSLIDSDNAAKRCGFASYSSILDVKSVTGS